MRNKIKREVKWRYRSNDTEREVTVRYGSIFGICAGRDISLYVASSI